MIQTNKVLRERLKVLTKIPNNSEPVKKTDLNTKFTDITNNIPSVTSLVTISALNKKVTVIESDWFYYYS